MMRRFFRPFPAKTTKSEKEYHQLSADVAVEPKPSSSITDFFANHTRSEKVMILSEQPQPTAAIRTSSLEAANPSNGGTSLQNCHKTNTARTRNRGNNLSFPPLSVALLSTLDANKFNFQTFNESALSPQHIGFNNNNYDDIMLTQLYACDRDDQCQSGVRPKPTHVGQHLAEKSPSLSSQPLPPQQQPPRWSVGKISVLILACLSLSDVVFHMVDAQMESLEAQDHYDALSADVIRPAFFYHHHYNNEAPQRRSNHHQRLSMGLGSAAISSVTTALSPILPFAGGIDLRREDYWTNGWWGSMSSVMEQVRIAFGGTSTPSDSSDGVNAVLETPRGGAAVTKKRKISVSSDHISVFSSAEPFAPLNEISELTLHDVAMCFQFAVENTRRDFQVNRFLQGLLPRVRKVIDRMSTAIATARGMGVVPPATGDEKTIVASGDVDAVSFCAAMRVFAEWRVLRQVPPGYKGYSVGMTLGQKDIVQNIAKIEQAVHSFVDHRVATMNEDDDDVRIHSPTLRELLQFEVDVGIQDVSKLPQLKEKSAAMGLLWVRRQLHYQTAIFANVMEVPERFESTRSAVQSAYDEVYNKYHGWAVQKIFSYSFQAAPDASEIYKYMDLHKLAKVRQEARDRFLDDVAGGRSSSIGKSDNPLERFGRHVGKEWNKFAGNVVQEWDKIASGVGQLLGQRAKPVPLLMTTNIAPLTTTTSIAMNSPVASPQAEQVAASADMTEGAPSEVQIENFIDHEMERNAYEHIRAYLQVAMPLLRDLESLFSEFNMNDPTKV